MPLRRRERSSGSALRPEPTAGRAAKSRFAGRGVVGAGAGTPDRRRLLVLFLLLVVWAVAGYFAVRSGVKRANGGLPRATTPSLQKRTCCSRTPARTSSCSAPTTRRTDSRASAGPALRLDDAAAHRPVASPARLSVGPARPPRVDSGSRRAEDQRRDADRRRRSSRSGRRTSASPACRSTTSSIVDFGAVRCADRRGRRHRRERAAEHPLEPLRLSRTHRAPAARNGRAGASRRACST